MVSTKLRINSGISNGRMSLTKDGTPLPPIKLWSFRRADRVIVDDVFLAIATEIDERSFIKTGYIAAG